VRTVNFTQKYSLFEFSGTLPYNFSDYDLYIDYIAGVNSNKSGFQVYQPGYPSPITSFQPASGYIVIKKAGLSFSMVLPDITGPDVLKFKRRYNIFTYPYSVPLDFSNYSDYLETVLIVNPTGTGFISYSPGYSSPFTAFEPGSSYLVVAYGDFDMENPGPSPTPTGTPEPTPNTTPTVTPTSTLLVTPTPTLTPTPQTTPATTPVATNPVTPSVTSSPGATPAATSPQTPTPTGTPIQTASPTPTGTSQPTPTPTATVGSTPTQTPSQTRTPAATPQATPSVTPSVTSSPGATPAATSPQTPTPTGTPIQTSTPTPTRTPVSTTTPTPTRTPVSTATPTTTTTKTLTPTPSVTMTKTPTMTPSVTPTDTPVSTSTPTQTPTQTPTATKTPGSPTVFYFNDRAPISNYSTTIDTSIVNGWNNVLTGVDFGSNVKTIGNFTFTSYFNLQKDLVIPDNINTIGSSTFSNNIFSSITIGQGLTSIGLQTFLLCDRVSAINVNINNQYYSSLNNVLFNKNQTELFKYCVGHPQTSYTIPNSVKNILYSAFRRADNLTQLTIGTGVWHIGIDALIQIPRVQRIFIPANVRTLERYSLGNSDWQDVTLSEGITGMAINALESCDSLTGINIPSTLVKLTSSSENECFMCSTRKLSAITVHPNNPVLSNDSYGALYNKNKTTFIKYPSANSRTQFIMPASVVFIGVPYFAFHYGCDRLTSIKFLGNAPTIGTPPPVVGSTDWFANAPNAIISYCSNKTGFTNPWGGKTPVQTGPC